METKKKVLVFVPKFPVATETFIQRELLELSSSPVLDVKILAILKGNAKLDPALQDRVTYKEASIVEILISPFKLLLRTIFSYKRVAAAWQSMEGKISPFRRLFNLLKAVGYYADIISYIRPDFIYAHFLSGPSTLCMAISKYMAVPFAISAHAKDVLVEGELIKSKVKNASFINICNVNAWEYCTKAAEGENTSKVRLRYHGIKFNEEPAISEPSTIPLIVNNSRMTAKKGQIYLLEAVKILKTRELNFDLKIISGGGELYGALSSFRNANNLADTVEFVNDGKPIFYEEVEKYYKKAAVFVFPSIDDESGDADGVANVLIEAAAHKVPIVATDSGSTAELVINNETGLVVPQRDAQALADALQRLLQYREEATRLAENAYKLARDKFDIVRNASLIEQDILEIVK